MSGWSLLIIPDVLRRAGLLSEPEHSTHGMHSEGEAILDRTEGGRGEKMSPVYYRVELLQFHIPCYKWNTEKIYLAS